MSVLITRAQSPDLLTSRSSGSALEQPFEWRHGFDLLQPLGQEDELGGLKLADGDGSHDAFGNTQVHRAAAAGDTGLLQRLLENSCDLRTKNKFEVTPLHAAVLLSQLDAAGLLLSAGASPADRGPNNMTALHCAVLCQDPKPMIFRVLEACGYVDGGSRAEAALASLEAEARASEQAEAAAAEADVQALCDRWAALEAEATDKNAQQLLDLQLEQQELMQRQQRRQQEQHQELQAERVKRMADAEREHQCFKAFVNSLDCHSQSALVLAINQGRAASVEALVAAKASIWGRVHYAAHHGHSKMLKELLQKGCPADELDEFSVTPILKASQGGYADCVLTLLDAKADIRHKVPGTQATCILLASAGKAARHAAAVEVLLAHGANIEDKDTKGNTPLLAACQSGNGAVVARLLTRNVDLNAVNLDLDCGLHLAARLGSAGHECVKELLVHQATQDLRNASGETPYVSALLAGHRDMAEFLKENGSNPHFQLHWAVENPNANPKPNGVEIPNLTKQILGQAPINLRDATGMTALHAAARAGNDPAVLQLLESKANPNIAAHDGSTALMAACENGHTASCKVLLSCEAHIGAFNVANRTALHFAARNGHADIVKQLTMTIMSLPDGCIVSSAPDDQQAEEDAKTLSDTTITATLTGNLLGRLKSLKRPKSSGGLAPQQHPLLRSVLLNAQDRSGTTAVILAAKYGCLSAVEQLIKAQADVHITDYRGWSVLHHAAYNGWLEISRVLIAEAGAPIDQATLNGETPLHFAANQDQMDVLKLLLLNEADIFAGTAYGQPALTKAAENGHCEVIEHLTSRGADLEHRDVAGCTPLQAAASRNHLGAVQLLLAEGACVNPLPGSPGSALCSAAQFAGVEVVGALLGAGADPNYAVNGSPPLKFACQRGDLKMVQLLLNSPEVKVDSRDADEAPALHFAIQEGHVEVVKELIRRGADINSKDWKQSTPLTSAASTGQVDICKLLIEEGADVMHMTFGGVMAVHRAAQAGHIKVLKLFLLPLDDCILDKFVATASGQTLMHIASSYGQTEVMRWLLFEVGLDVNQTCQGQQLKRDQVHWKQWNRQFITIQGSIVRSVAVEDEGFQGPALAVHLLNNDRQLSYMEFEIQEGTHPCNISFGLGVDNGRYDYMCGLIPDTVGLNGLDGCCLTGAYSTIKQYTHKFGKGDTIGLVYNPAFRTLSYTRNGVHLGTAAKRLAPGKQSLMIGFGEPGIKLEANFFEASDCKYDKLFEAGFDELLMEEEHVQNPGNLAHPWKVKAKICPLHMAASSKSLSSLKLLLDLGAVVDQRDAEGWTAMHYTAIVGWDEGARLLLEYRADPNVVSLFDSTPILMSVKSSHAGVTQVLLESGAKLRCSAGERDRKGRTLLMWAANTGNSAIMQMLLERDVSIRAKDKLGRTALQYACNEQVVTYLENALNQMDTFRGVFLIGKQQDITEGSAGKVIMAMHQVTNNNVAIKFYRDRLMRDTSAAMLQELMPAHRFIATIPRDMNPAEVVFEDTDNRVPGCPYALVVEGGGEDLSELMARTGSTPMPENQIRYTFECIATAVNVLHSLGRVHHDLKSGNIVRFFDGTYRLVDLDNCRIAGVENHGLTTLEICPPEMSRPLLFKTPHELKSDYSADMWALGCILYEMVTHTQFLTKLKREWEGRRLDNSMLGEALDLLANLQQSQVDQVIDNLQERKRGRMLVELTSDLMRMLLKVDPRDRCTSEDVLWHSFLKGGTTASMDERNLAGVRSTLNVVHDKVDKVLLATTDIRERTINIQALSEETRDTIATCARRISGLRSLVMEVATRSEYPSTFSIGPDLNFKELLRPEAEKNAALVKWLLTLKEVTMGGKTMADVMKQLVGVKNLRLALLCERCMEPQTSYKIEENPPLVANLLPAFQVGLQMMKLYNIGACAGKFFFPALPTVPGELVAKSQEFVNSMGFKSSAQDFNCIQETLDKRQRELELGEQSEEIKGGQQLGVSYRELGNFLDKHDACKDWGGLMVVETEEEEASSHAVDCKGGVLWVCKACMTNAQGSSHETTHKASPVSEARIRKPSTEHQQTKQPVTPAKSLKSGLCGLGLGSSNNKVFPD